MVSSLLDELVNYFLSLFVTFLLQVSDERVQMSRTVVSLHYRLMSLNDPSNACKHTKTLVESTPSYKAQQTQDNRPIFSPSSSNVSVSANISSALLSPKSPPVAKSKFSSALEASCGKEGKNMNIIMKCMNK